MPCTRKSHCFSISQKPPKLPLITLAAEPHLIYGSLGITHKFIPLIRRLEPHLISSVTVTCCSGFSPYSLTAQEPQIAYGGQLSTVRPLLFGITQGSFVGLSLYVTLCCTLHGQI